MQLSSPTSVTRSVAVVADAIPFESIPLDLVTDLSLSDVGDVWDDATDFVTDSAAVIGKHGGRIVGRTAQGAWRNRSTVATVLILTLAVIGVVSLIRRRTDEDSATP